MKVSAFAKHWGLSPEALLSRMADAGLPQQSENEDISKEQQQQLERQLSGGETIQLLRNLRGFSRAQLAEKAGISERQIARIEAYKTAPNPAHQKKLAAALRVHVRDLFGSTEFARRLHQFEPGSIEYEKSRGKAAKPMSATVSTQARLAYALIRRRYGWTIGEIVELTPVLFVLLAEGSLAHRRKKHDQMDETWKSAADELKSFLGEFREQLQEEKESIESFDLRGVNKQRVSAAVFRNERDEDPFVTYLSHLADELELQDDEPRCFQGERRLFARICRAELDWLAGGSERARWALEYGDVNVATIPDDLLAEDERGFEIPHEEKASSRRIKWLESQLTADMERAVRDWRENLGVVDRGGLRCPNPTCGKPAIPQDKFCTECGSPLQSTQST